MKVRMNPYLIADRNKKIIEDFVKTGDSEKAIAKRHKTSLGNVDRIINAYLNAKPNAIVKNIFE